MKKSILLVDPQTLLLELLVPSLEREFPNCSFMTSNSLNGARTILERQSFDVLITDIAGLEGAGLSIILHARESSPKTRPIILTNELSAFWVNRALRAGVLGVITKSSNIAELILAIKAALDGKKYLSPSITQQYWDYVRRSKNGDPLELLCRRELEVLIQIGHGKTWKAISETLGITPRTISVHKHNIAKKTGIKTNAGIAQYCMTRGLLTGGAKNVESHVFTEEKELTAKAA